MTHRDNEREPAENGAEESVITSLDSRSGTSPNREPEIEPDDETRGESFDDLADVEHHIDLSGILRRAMEVSLGGDERDESGGPLPASELVAGDVTGMIDSILARLDGIEDALRYLATAVNKVEDATQESHHHQMVELGRQRKELLSQQKQAATGKVLVVCAPWIDTLRSMRAQLPPKQVAVARELGTVIDSLVMILRLLGYAEFHVEPGEQFDPTFMECTGLAPGEPGIVVREEHPGYKAGDAVARPAGVRVGAEASGKPGSPD